MQLEFEDIDIFRCFHYGICTTAGAAYFGIGELSHKFENNIENYLVVTLCLLVQFVVEIGKEGLQAGKKGIVVSTLQFIDELADVKPLIVILHSSIERYQEIHETVTHLIVGKFQQVVAETFIISFYRQISTLVN